MSRDLRVSFQQIVGWQRFSCRSAWNQNAYSRSRQLRQSRKFIVAINLSALATPLKWPEFLFFLSVPFSPSFSIREESADHSRPAGLAQARHCAWSRRDSRESETWKEGKSQDVYENTRGTLPLDEYLPFTHNGTDCLSQDHRIHESFIVVLQPQLARISAIVPRHQLPSLSRRRRSPVIIISRDRGRFKKQARSKIEHRLAQCADSIKRFCDGNVNVSVRRRRLFCTRAYL